MPTRIETLQQLLEVSPADCFLRYGLAQEHIKADQAIEAIAQFDKILEINPDYQAAYYHAGKTFEKLGRADDARSIYQRGLETAARTGDAHAGSELQAALTELG